MGLAERRPQVRAGLCRQVHRQNLVGDQVGELLPGGGYFTRIFANTVGAHGHVYAIVPSELVAAMPKAPDAVQWHLDHHPMERWPELLAIFEAGAKRTNDLEILQALAQWRLRQQLR